MIEPRTRDGKFGTDFSVLDLVGGFSPDAWQRVLASPQMPDLWAREAHTLFTFDLGLRRHWLFLDMATDGRFALRYQVDADAGEPEQMLFSVRDADAMNEFVVLDDLAFYPLGSFVDGDVAHASIVAFLTHPTNPPASVVWMQGDNLDWPEGGC